MVPLFTFIWFCDLLACSESQTSTGNNPAADHESETRFLYRSSHCLFRGTQSTPHPLPIMQRFCLAGLPVKEKKNLLNCYGFSTFLKMFLFPGESYNHTVETQTNLQTRRETSGCSERNLCSHRFGGSSTKSWHQSTFH